jgi:hypothetical protein
MEYRAMLRNDSHGTNIYDIYLIFRCMYNVAKYAIVWVLIRTVAVKRLMSVRSMAGTAFVVCAAGCASAWRSWGHWCVLPAVPVRDVAVVTRCCDEKRRTECWEWQCLDWCSARLSCRVTGPRRAAWPVCRALLLVSCCVVCDVYCFTYRQRIDEWMPALVFDLPLYWATAVPTILP